MSSSPFLRISSDLSNVNYEIMSSRNVCLTAHANKAIPDEVHIDLITKCSDRPGLAGTLIRRLENTLSKPCSLLLQDIATVQCGKISVYLSDIELVKTGHTFYGRMGFRPIALGVKADYDDNVETMHGLVLGGVRDGLMALLPECRDRIRAAGDHKLVRNLMRELITKSECQHIVSRLPALHSLFGTQSLAKAHYVKRLDRMKGNV